MDKRFAVAALDQELPQMALLILDVNDVQRQYQQALESAMAQGVSLVSSTSYRMSGRGGAYRITAWKCEDSPRLNLRVDCSNAIVAGMVEAALTKCATFNAQDMRKTDQGFRCTIEGAQKAVTDSYGLMFP